MSNQESVFTLLGQGIRDLSFENKIEFIKPINEQPEINVDIQANAKNIEGSVFEVTLTIRSEAKHDKKIIFLVELQYMGICQLENIPKESINPLLMIQVPALLFPYCRQIISDVTSNAGFPPLFLQPVDFAALYQQQQENEELISGLPN